MNKTTATVIACVVCFLIIVAYAALKVIYGISGLISSIIFVLVISLAWGGIRALAQSDKENDKENEESFHKPGEPEK